MFLSFLPTRHLANFLLASYVLIVIPGPSVMFIVARGVALGRRAALATVLGNTAGLALQLLLVCAGIGGLVARSAPALEAVTLAGAGYLLLLGLRTLRGLDSQSRPVPETAGLPTPTIVRQGFVVGLTNPKGLIIFTAFLPRFVDRSAGEVTVQLLALGAICVALALASDGAWALAAGSVARWFSSSSRRVDGLRIAGGLTLIVLGVALLVAGLLGGA